jgi:two-component system response regulator QseB
MNDDPRVLVIEDDHDLAEMLVRLLAQEGYGVDPFADGQSALHSALTTPPDVIILDRRLPDGDGLELMSRMRHGGVLAPVLILSAYGTIADRVAGLDAGAQDYLVKPFAVDELLARLRALLRLPRDQVASLPLPGGHLDVDTHTVSSMHGPEIVLSRREAELLTLLARRPRQVFTRGELRELIFPDTESSSIVDTYVYYLRRKLGREVVQTVRGLGYRLGPGEAT